MKKTSHFGISTIKLDSLLSDNKIEKYDKIYMKIDVDGFEDKVLNGAIKFVDRAKDLTIVIEDFVDPKIIKLLKKKFTFIIKRTPYNSFWIKKN